MNFYQIQTKFRDEIRPRFGVMRAREFIMKDAYSFHVDYADLEREYRNMYDTYTRIFERLGLKFRAVAADTGAIGGTGSHEFHVLADSGEDAIAFSPDSDYAANVELAEALPPSTPRAAPARAMEKIATPGQHTIEEVSAFLKVPPERILKTLLVVTGDQQVLSAAAARRPHAQRDQGRQEIPAQRRLSLRLGGRGAAGACGATPGSIGPVGDHQVPIIADRARGCA